MRTTMTAIGLAMAAAAHAQQPAAPIVTAALDAPAEPDIVVVGKRDRLLDLPGSAAKLEPEDLARANVFTINEALRRVPGVTVRDEEGLGLRPNIGIRGLNPTRSTKTLLLEDGVPLAFAPYGDNASYYFPPFERFDGIEVLKGASQIRFGPQTIAGVVNLLTPTATDTLSGRARLTGGNRGYLAADALVSGPVLGGLGLIHASHKEFDGLRDNHRLRVSDALLKQRWEFGAHALTAKLAYTTENSQVSYSGLTRAEFEADPRGNPFENDRFDVDRYSATLTHALDATPNLRIVTTGYYHRLNRDWWRQSSNSGQRPADSSDPTCAGIANVSTTCGNEGRLRTYDTYGLETRLRFATAPFGLPGETELGARIHREEQERRQWNGDTPDARQPGTSVNAGVREDQRRTTSAMSAFAQSTVRFGPLSVTPGVRVELVDYGRLTRPIPTRVAGAPGPALTAESEGSTSVEQVIPAIAASLRVTDRIAIYGGAHRGFAPPGVADILTAGGGAVELDSELSWNYELGARGTLARGVDFDLTGFRLDFENQIVAQSVAGGVGATLTSAGRTRHQGLEASLALSSADAGWTDGFDVFARAALTWLDVARYASTRIASPACDGAPAGTPVRVRGGALPCGQATNIDGNRLPYAPEWLASAALGARVGWVEGLVEVQGQSSQYGDDVNTIDATADGQRGRIGGWATVNATLNIGPPDGRLTGFVAVKNIGDRLYIVDRARGILPGDPRLVQAGVKARF